MACTKGAYEKAMREAREERMAAMEELFAPDKDFATKMTGFDRVWGKYNEATAKLVRCRCDACQAERVLGALEGW